MRKLNLASSSVVAELLLIGPAVAQDNSVPSSSPLSTSSSQADWSGWYLGVQLGCLGSDVEINDRLDGDARDSAPVWASTDFDGTADSQDTSDRADGWTADVGAEYAINADRV